MPTAPLRRMIALWRNAGGQVAVTLALLLIPLLAAAGGAIEFSGVSSVKTNMQDALDSAALELAKDGPTLTSGQYQPTAQTWFNSNFHATNLTGTTVTATFDPATQTAVVNGSGSYATMLLKLVGMTTINVNGSATASASSKWPICVDITSPLGKHTLLTAGAGTIKFSNCMVQVNTSDWDAVEARANSSISSTNGDNCFVGDIHYGNVTPVKDPTCTMFPDPFAGYAMPASAATCTYNNVIVTTPGQTLQPGTYCGGLTISDSTTLAPGVYIMKNGGFEVTHGTVNGSGVTFIFTGTQAWGGKGAGTLVGGFEIKGDATVNLSADVAADAGQFAGFVFYFDPASAANCQEVSDGAQAKQNPKSGECESLVYADAKLTVTGVTYLVGSELVVASNGALTVNPGTLMTDFLAVIDSGQMTLTNNSDASTAAQIALQKSGKSFGVALVR